MCSAVVLSRRAGVCDGMLLPLGRHQARWLAGLAIFGPRSLRMEQSSYCFPYWASWLTLLCVVGCFKG